MLFQNGPIEAIQQFFGLGHAMLFEIICLPGDVWGMVMVLGIGRWLWGRETCYLLLGTIIVAALTKQLMTLAFGVPRPEGPEIVVYHDVDLGSFPSGHVYVATVAWGMFWALGLMPLWLPLTLAVAVAVGRLYLGLHYLVDVVAGIVLAVPVIFAWLYAWTWLRPQLARLPSKFWMGAAVTVVVGTSVTLWMSPDNPRRWEIFGFVLGTALGLLADYRWSGATTVRSPGNRMLALSAGFAVLTVLIYLDLTVATGAVLLNGALMTLASLWALLAAPALFERLGWSAGNGVTAPAGGRA